MVCNQVFEHVDYALRAALRSNERFHLIPGDYYRASGARTSRASCDTTLGRLDDHACLAFGAGDYPPMEQHMLADSQHACRVQALRTLFSAIEASTPGAHEDQGTKESSSKATKGARWLVALPFLASRFCLQFRVVRYIFFDALHDEMSSVRVVDESDGWDVASCVTSETHQIIMLAASSSCPRWLFRLVLRPTSK